MQIEYTYLPCINIIHRLGPFDPENNMGPEKVWYDGSGFMKTRISTQVELQASASNHK